MAAFEHIDNWMGWEEERTRDFLDSRYGRYYAERMAGYDDWKRRLTHDNRLERNCRDFFKESDTQGYIAWCRFNNTNPTDRALDAVNLSRSDIQAALVNTLGLDYTPAEVREMILRAGPLARALATLLDDLPEEIRKSYIGR